MDYGELLRAQAARYGAKPFLIWDGEKISYAALLREAEDLAKKIKKFSMGHRLLGIWSRSPVSQLTAFLAAEIAGAVPVILHEFLDGEKLAEFLAERPVSCLLKDEGEWHALSRKETEELPREVVMGVLTSGTSALPKILYRTYESWADFFPVQNDVFAVNETTRLYLQGSFGFTGNLSYVMGTMAAGGTVIGTSSIKPKRWLSDIGNFSATHIYMIPSKLSALCRARGSAENVTRILSGSQLMTAELLGKLNEHFPNAEIFLYYGSTELDYVSYITGDELLKRPGCVGRPFPGVTVELRDGELFAATPGIVYGKPSPYTSGDLADIDADGWIYFKGRKADLYSIKGNHVAKREVVGALSEIPGVLEAELLPYETRAGETKLAAFLSAETLTKKEILSALAGKLHPWEIPSRFFFLKEIPKASTGKPDFQAMRELMKTEGRTKE